MTHTFTTTVELGGKTATGLEVPAAVVEALGSGRKPAVVVSVGGHSYRSTVAVRDGRFLIALSAANRAAAGVEAGQTVEVGLDLDTAERTVEVPEVLAHALDERPGARAAFDALSYSRRREHVTAVESAKREETRNRRITAIVDGLA